MAKHSNCKTKWKSLRKYDMFGHLITMNFNQRGNRHKTQVGALFSIGIKFCIYLYVALTFKTLLTLGANKNTTILSSEKIEEFGKIHYKSTEHLTFFVLKHQITQQPVMLGDELF